MDTSFDVIVIGAGPAGLAAATEAARAGLRTLCLDKLAPGGVLINLSQLHGVAEASDGPQMASQLTDQATAAGAGLLRRPALCRTAGRRGRRRRLGILRS